jgi:hypothetical protein
VKCDIAAFSQRVEQGLLPLAPSRTCGGSSTQSRKHLSNDVSETYNDKTCVRGTLLGDNIICGVVHDPGID